MSNMEDEMARLRADPRVRVIDDSGCEEEDPIEVIEAMFRRPPDFVTCGPEGEAPDDVTLGPVTISALAYARLSHRATLEGVPTARVVQDLLERHA
ncbi:MAG: hypothetical protein ACT4PP_12975 [Sporichthyaceae bacterium]